ncbi:hybrid sensor histidine kinase/response regulator [Thalassotalea sp. 42_200_T64]|nr:hybrid sensor histidine kinase/response regulator [Thalassotalea sp. 42_200_T64]
MFPNWQLVITSIGYIGVLFIIAFLGDKYRHKLASKHHTIIYALSLGVYCTSWGFLGTAGQAANYSFSYLSVYIAPILLFFFSWPFIQRMIKVSLQLNITSIADLLAARFGKSSRLAVLITLVTLIGTVPYIALQLKAIVHSYTILQEDQYLSLWQLGLIVSAILAGFTIIFGIRAIDVTERHPGVMMAIAFESIIKLVAFLSIGLFVSFYLFDSPLTIWSLATENTGAEHNFTLSKFVSMLGLLVIAMSAFLCFPRQFQVMVVELKEQAHTKLSRWLFPGYVAIFALFAIPIGLSGRLLYGSSLDAEAYALFLPAYSGQLWLTLFSFLGAVSAASSMVIVSTIALSTMLSNEIVFPFLFKHSNIQQTDFKKFKGKLLLIRKALVIFIILLCYGMFITAPPDTLASLGEVAFGAIAQIGPPLFAAFYLRKVSLHAVLLAVSSGFMIWFLLNLLPQLGFYPHPFSGAVVSSTTLATLLGLTVNVLMLLLVSRISRPSFQEQSQIEHFIERPSFDKKLPISQGKINANELALLVTRFVGHEKSALCFAEFNQMYDPLNTNKQRYNEAIIFHTENTLAKVMGSASARLVISFAIDGRDMALDEVAQIVEGASSHRIEFNRSVLSSAIENTNEGISVIDSNLNMVAWNKPYLELFKYPEELVYIGSPIKDLIYYNLKDRPEYTHSLDQQVERRLQFFRDGSKHSAERIQPNGKIIRIEGNPIPDGGFVMIFTDITVYKQAEQLLKEENLDLESRVLERTKKLENAYKKLEQSNKELAVARAKAEQAHLKKSQYLKACSHDLMQPLSAARLFSSTLAMSDCLGKAEKEHVNYIDNSLKTANDLLRDLNEISRIESGNITPKITQFSLNDVFASIENEFSPLAQKHHVEFHWVKTHIWLNSDAKLLRRILQNLLSNAFRYASPGKVLLGCRRKGNSIEIQVIDNGPGIPYAQQETVFEQFTQLESSQHIGVKGLGLGLNIAQSLSQLLSSRLQLNSRPEQGCNFNLSLAISSPLLHQVLNKAPVMQVSLEGVNVLCIDNEPDVLEGMKNLLSAWKCNVFCAKDSKQAITVFKRYQSSIDIILVDYQLDKNENGITLFKQLQEIRNYPLPAILITATTDDDVLKRSQIAGMSYLRKLIKPIALRALMSSLLTKTLQQNYSNDAEND